MKKSGRKFFVIVIVLFLLAGIGVAVFAQKRAEDQAQEKQEKLEKQKKEQAREKKEQARKKQEAKKRKNRNKKRRNLRTDQAQVPHNPVKQQIRQHFMYQVRIWWMLMDIQLYYMA